MFSMMKVFPDSLLIISYMQLWERESDSAGKSKQGVGSSQNFSNFFLYSLFSNAEYGAPGASTELKYLFKYLL